MPGNEKQRLDAVNKLLLDLREAEGRELVIMGSSAIELGLAESIRAHLPTHAPNSVSALLDGMSGGTPPLGTFEAKIEMAAALGVVSEAVRADLHRFRRLRNKYAHQFRDLELEAPPISDCVRDLTAWRSPAELGPAVDFESEEKDYVGGIHVDGDWVELNQHLVLVDGADRVGLYLPMADSAQNPEMSMTETLRFEIWALAFAVIAPGAIHWINSQAAAMPGGLA